MRSPGAPLVGEIARVDADGIVWVDFPANALGPVEARTLVQDLHAGARVLLCFDQGDPTRPIVLGIVHDRAQTKGRQIELKANKIVIEAKESISLQCGEATLEASKDGKLKLSGRDVVSRASRTNKVQGSTVRLN